MALQRVLQADKSLLVRRDKNGADKQGIGKDKHILAGPTGSGKDQRQHRSYVDFPINSAFWANVKGVVKCELAVKTNNTNPHFEVGSAPKVRVSSITNGWNDGSHAEGDWDVHDYESVDLDPGPRPVDWSLRINPDTGDPQNNLWTYIDVTYLMVRIAPKSVIFPDGTFGKGQPNHGFMIRATSETDPHGRAIFYSNDAGSANDPQLILNYDPTNQAPTAPGIESPPTSGTVTFADRFEGVHNDPDGDPMAAYDIRIYDALTGGKLVWPKIDATHPFKELVATYTETQTGRFSMPLTAAGGALKLDTVFGWTVRTKDTNGVWGPTSSTRRSLRITSSAPSVGIAFLGTLDTIKSSKFGGNYTDPEKPAKFQLQARAIAAHTDAAFSDPTTLLWDEGELFPTLAESTPNVDGICVIRRDWAGKQVGPGDYTYRFRAQDTTGIWSAWVYDDFTVLHDIDPTDFSPGQPGDLVPTLTTQYDRPAPVRVALYKMGSRRGPGALIGYIDDPIDLGGSTYLNGGGEVYFSLPALHPYCPSIEPHQVHYRVEQWYGDRYIVKFAGLITDFDADADTAVFYGTDYLGLLQTAVDERQPDKPETPSNMNGGGGAKYVDQKISDIIRDQLLYHYGAADSPVGFINVPAKTPPAWPSIPEKVVIYATYTEALPFITGLIDSHKQGTGRESRLYVKPAADYSSWSWALADPWGKDRPNIRLEWGGILNDFRVIALGDFATRVLALGTKRGEVKVYRAKGPKVQSDGLAENVWGRHAATRLYQDINDLNDLQRRANEAAAQLGKVGKRLALAIKADALQPFDGWDVGDNIIVDIERGVVDTIGKGTVTDAGYGSGGFWTILGVEWHYYPDGHSDLTLTVSPKKTLSEADPDLIPSVNPGLPVEWQVGYGVPVGYGQPPQPTPPPATAFGAPTVLDEVTPFSYPLSTEDVIAENYMDLNSGCVYQIEPVTGVYTQVYCPPGAGGGTPGIDTSPPPVPVIKGVPKSVTIVQDDGSSYTAIEVTVGYEPPLPSDGSVLADLQEIVIDATRWKVNDPPVPDWTRAQSRIRPSDDATGTKDTVVVLAPTTMGISYAVRAAAIDVIGNRSGWSPIVDSSPGDDTEAPRQVSNIHLQSGMSTAGLRWDPVTASDFAYTEVQYRTAAFGGLPEVIADPDHVPPIEGLPALPPYGVGPWVSVRVATTVLVISGLQNGDARDPKAVEFRLRSVDLLGNTLNQTGVDADGLPTWESVKVDDPASDEKGWVTIDFLGVPLVAKPTPIPGNTLLWNEAIIEDVFAGAINATWITSGALRVGNAPPVKDTDTVGDPRIEVYDADGNLVGRWSAEGIEVMDPANDTYKMVLTDASLTIWSGVGTPDEFPNVRLTPLGIDAGSITFGSMRGGHNLVLNSSFEMGNFTSATVKNSAWDTGVEWNAVGSRQGADVNITPPVAGTTALTMATVI